MNIVTGIDLVEIKKIEKIIQNPRFLTRVFSDQEIALFQQKGAHAVSSIAANFAAKEAFSKVLGTGIRGFSLREVSLLRHQNGAPFFDLTGRAAQLVQQQNLQLSVSVTHTDEYAAVVVVGYCT